MYKFVITGCPRSGTSFIARFLTSAGIQCNHEAYYGLPSSGFWCPEPQGEASWLAVPHLQKDIPKWKCPVIHLVRDPLKVINSMYQQSFLGDTQFYKNPYTFIASLSIPEMKYEPELDRYIGFWIMWNECIEPFAKHRLKIEDIDDNPKILFDVLKTKMPEGKLFSDKKCNSFKNKKIKQLTLKDLEKSKLYKRFIEKAKEYGYTY